MYINQVISKCGYNNKWPKALRHGTTYCGLDLKDPSTEAIIKKIKGIQSLFYKPDSRKVVQYVLAWYQHVSELSQPILETSHNATKYVNSGWVNNLIELLQDHGLQIKLKQNFVHAPQRINDRFLMDDITK